MGALWYADFHIHIGRAFGRPVKVAAAPSLTLANLVDHARNAKGLDLITVIDGTCTGVLAEVGEWLKNGTVLQRPGGGLVHENGLVFFLGAEVEIAGPQGGAAHFGSWFGSYAAAEDFHRWLVTVQRNPFLSSQKANVSAETLQRNTVERGGLFVIHHAFTPHKGMYGNCVEHMHEMVDPSLVDAVELGLSADSDMADCLDELADFTFITNSDAHSLPKVAREYNALRLASCSFDEVRLALRRQDGRAVAANYGLHPALGKYHRTLCLDCGAIWLQGAGVCACGSVNRVPGVYDRLLEIRDRDTPRHPAHRPPYVHQVPLEFVPGLGPKAYRRLLEAFGTEMAVLHRAERRELEEVVGPVLAERIDQARTGAVSIKSGAGGTYGKLVISV